MSDNGRNTTHSPALEHLLLVMEYQKMMGTMMIVGKFLISMMNPMIIPMMIPRMTG